MALQKELAGRVVCRSPKRIGKIASVAGVDAGYRGGRACAAVVVVSLSDLGTTEEVQFAGPLSFPYIPGLLSFREAPAVLQALEKLKVPPDLLMVDGHGIAHPRRLGIASHIGLATGIPTIGCAKTRLVGEYREPSRRRGHRSPLEDGGETIGAVVRTRTGVKPVFVSVGHRVNLEDSVRLVLQTCDGYRLPEPIRRADWLSRKHE
jgi:deoxyribonuclease V